MIEIAAIRRAKIVIIENVAAVNGRLGRPTKEGKEERPPANVAAPDTSANVRTCLDLKNKLIR
jgi:hypothetical protein